MLLQAVCVGKGCCIVNAKMDTHAVLPLLHCPNSVDMIKTDVET